MSNFSMRTLTGTVYVVLMVLGVLWSYWLLSMLMVFFAVFGVLEYSSLFRLNKPQTFVLASAAGLMLVLASIYFNLGIGFFGWSTIAVFLLAPIIVSSLGGNAIVSYSGLGYVVLPLTIMMGIRGGLINNVEENRWILLGMLLLLWVNDTGAYLIGRWLGKHHLAPVISPKKTWEGLFGGFFIAALTAWVLALFLEQLSLTQWLIIFLVTVTFGTIGDLFESALKRKAGVKDSGKILPGHGGVLDRIDSLLFALPFVFAVLVNIFAA